LSTGVETNGAPATAVNAVRQLLFDPDRMPRR
jgi:hypothetical protein